MFRQIGPRQRSSVHALVREIEALPPLRRCGWVVLIEGLSVEVAGAAGAVSLGGKVRLTCSSGTEISCEVARFRDGRALLRPGGSAMAQREIGPSGGEPPATEGYLPTVFAELPCLLEGAGPGVQGTAGSITGLVTVTVEGDDHNEPMPDRARGILDGHIVLDRATAERGRFPATSGLKSGSRATCSSSDEQAIMMRLRSQLAPYEDMAELDPAGRLQKRHECGSRCRNQYPSAGGGFPFTNKGRALHTGRRLCRAQHNPERRSGER